MYSLSFVVATADFFLPFWLVCDTCDEGFPRKKVFIARTVKSTVLEEKMFPRQLQQLLHCTFGASSRGKIQSLATGGIELDWQTKNFFVD